MHPVLLFVAAASLWYGRWDLAVGDAGGWLQVAPGPNIQIVPRVGGVKPVESFDLKEDRLSFSNLEWVGKWEHIKYDLTLRDGRIAGTATRESGAASPVSGLRAPELKHRVSSWGPPADLSWKVTSPTKPGNWSVAGGSISNSRSGPNLCTVQEFRDFRLDLEFNCPPGSNSGIMLRGRYELQIEEEPDNHEDVGRTGAIYQFLAPAVHVPSRPGVWRNLSVELVGRVVTVTLDGVKIHDAREIPGPTSGGFNSNEGEPGPIILQGDHGAIAFRNLVVRPGIE